MPISNSAPVWDMLPEIAVGESVCIQRDNTNDVWNAALLSRVADTTYNLRTQAAELAGRARWGTRRQIAEDAEHFLLYGQLPGPDGMRW